jgi:peptide/nickel transport system ATP-binding protein
MAADDLLRLEGLSVHFTVRRSVLDVLARRDAGVVRAVDGIDLAIRRGEVLALVGESGSGKTTTGRVVVKLTRQTAGRIVFDGRDVSAAWGAGALRGYRRRVQMIFQDPYETLNPKQTIHDFVAEPVDVNGLAASPADREERVVRALEVAGLRPGADFAMRFPHELSGGQRQRVAIARALAVEPRVIVADEPISMLDVSIRIGILNLMADLREQQDIAFLYVTHDLASARYVADHVLVMYAGQIVEEGPPEQVLGAPLHPYTQLLLASVPDPARPRPAEIELRKGLAAAAVDPAPGCRFLQRCPLAVELCSNVTPELVEARPMQRARCHVTAPSPEIREDDHARAV